MRTDIANRDVSRDAAIPQDAREIIVRCELAEQLFFFRGEVEWSGVLERGRNGEDEFLRPDQDGVRACFEDDGDAVWATLGC